MELNERFSSQAISHPVTDQTQIGLVSVLWLLHVSLELFIYKNGNIAGISHFMATLAKKPTNPSANSTLCRRGNWIKCLSPSWGHPHAVSCGARSSWFQISKSLANSLGSCRQVTVFSASAPHLQGKANNNTDLFYRAVVRIVA